LATILSQSRIRKTWEFRLEGILGRPVDLVIADTVKPRLRPIIEHEVVMHRDPRLYLDDILGAITQIREYTSTLYYDSFRQDRKTQDVVVGNLEIVGETPGRLPESIWMNATDIEWLKIVVMRNILENTHSAFFIHRQQCRQDIIIWIIIKFCGKDHRGTRMSLNNTGARNHLN
jgi:uncharacterized protein with HEPN domain